MHEKDKQKLRDSILKAGENVHPNYRVAFYLNPIDFTIESYIRTGASVPTPAYHGIWNLIFVAPANAIPDSVVENLLDLEEYLQQDCENFLGQEWDGQNYKGKWSEEPTDYGSLKPIVIGSYWDPEDWFEPVLSDLKSAWQSGLTAEQIIDREYLGDNEGCVDAQQALDWLRSQIEEWENEEEG